MNISGRQSLNVIDARQSHPASEGIRVIRIVSETGTPMQFAQVVTYVALRDHKAEIGLFVAFAVFAAWALRDLCRLSRIVRRRREPRSSAPTTDCADRIGLEFSREAALAEVPQ